MHSSRRNRVRLTGLTLAILACLLSPAPRADAEPPTPPPYYAITNVRVVTGAGAPVEGATVLLANGLVEAVGKNLKVPGDARVVDGKGLTLYPGMIDALTTLARKPEPESPAGGPPSRGPVINGPEDRPQTTPWVSGAEELAEDARIEKWRKAGFTAAVTAPEKGIFPGQAALINLVDQPDRQSVLATPVAQRLNFTGGAEMAASFPGSLMGMLAYIKQVFLDVDHYTKVKAIYAKDPAGRVRPEYDRTLEPLETAIAEKTPFLMPANLGREIDRALALRKTLGVQTVIYGGQGAYDRVDALRAAAVPVLVNLNWPKEEKNRDPDAETPLRTLAHRRMAPTTPSALAAAGVHFAFYSGGLATTSEIFESVRAATANGLSNEAALAALTSNAAAILGVSNRLGTIEKGKIANLVLATDWPWAEGVEVRAVFVDGRMYQERKDEEPSEPPASDVSGIWTLTMQSPRGTREMTADITMGKDGKVKGKITSESGESVMDEGRMSASLLRFKTTREFGGRSVTASWSLTVEGEKMSGTMSAGPMQMDVTGVLKSKPEAKPETAATEEKKTEVSLEELRAALRQYEGPVKKMGTYAITNAQVWTVSGGTIENGTVVVTGGKIRAVGRDVKIPAGADVIDAKGGALIPGIIDCHSHIAIEGGVNEGTLSVTAMVAIADVVNPDDISIYRALAGGVTSANLLHGSANAIGGQNQVVKLRWGADAEGMKFQGAPPGIKFALGENPKRSNMGGMSSIPPRYPQTRMGVMDVIRDAFTRARTYRQEWANYKAGPRNGIKPELPRRDLELEALGEILDGTRKVHAHCYRADEILQLMRVAEEFGFHVATLQHVLEGYKIADEIAAHGAGASTFSDWWGYKVEAYDAIPYNAALMAERGVIVSMNSDSGEEMRHLNQEAAKAIRWGGMSEIDALKLVTLNPAKQLGIDNRVGTIEEGKDADLVLYNGNPLAIGSVVQKTFVDGDLYFDLEADHARQTMIATLEERMQSKGKGGEKKEAGGMEWMGGGARSAPSPEVRWADGPYSCREDDR